MMFSLFSSRRCVLFKRAASVSIFSFAAFLAGCSYQGISFDELQAKRYQQHRAASNPVPSEPVYGYSDTERGGTATTASLEPVRITRERVAPVRVASLDKNYVGSSYAMQPVGSHDAGNGRAPAGRRYAQSGPAYYADPAYTKPRSYRAPERDDYASEDYRSEKADSYEDYKSRQRAASRQAYRGGYDYYTVIEGDTLYSLARRFGVSTTKLAKANGILGSTIYAGQKLRVPAGSGYTASYRDERPSYRDERPSKRYERTDYDRADTYDERDNERSEDPDYSSYDRKSPAPRPRTYSSYEDYRENNATQPYRKESRKSAYRDDEADEYQGGDRKRVTTYKRYRVRRGDTLYAIARYHRIDYRELAAINDVSPSEKLFPGQVLRIPAARGHDNDGGYDRDQYSEKRKPSRNYVPASNHDDLPYWKRPSVTRTQQGAPERAVAETQTPPASEAGGRERKRSAEIEVVDRGDGRNEERPAGKAETEAEVEAEPKKTVLAAHSDVKASQSSPASPQVSAGDCNALLEKPIPRTAKTFREPVQGLVIAKFGTRKDNTVNDGIDFSVPKGTPVKAAENGVVAYTGDELPGFGKLILVRHADGYVTAYAHNDEVLVRRCDIVKRGQVISKAGATGNVSKPMLHFELRKDSKPVDPEGYFTRS